LLLPPSFSFGAVFFFSKGGRLLAVTPNQILRATGRDFLPPLSPSFSFMPWRVPTLRNVALTATINARWGVFPLLFSPVPRVAIGV